jgi:hypothetical protein
MRGSITTETGSIWRLPNNEASVESSGRSRSPSDTNCESTVSIFNHYSAQAQTLIRFQTPLSRNTLKLLPFASRRHRNGPCFTSGSGARRLEAPAVFLVGILEDSSSRQCTKKYIKKTLPFCQIAMVKTIRLQISSMARFLDSTIGAVSIQRYVPPFHNTRCIGFHS